MRRASCFLLCPLMLLGAQRWASAQARLPTSGDIGSAAFEHTRRGRSARDAGRWTEAEASFKGALVATGSASLTEAQRAEIVGELGLCELMLGKHRDAAEHLAESLSHRAVLSPRLRQRFDDGRRRAVAKVVRLYLSVTPSDAEVLIDGKRMGQHSPSQEIFLEPGKHTVRARMTGHGDDVNTFSASAGEQRTVAVQLPGAPRASVITAAPPKPERAERDATGSTFRTVGIIATGTTAMVGSLFLAVAVVSHDEMVDRKAELRGEGWPRDACTGSNVPGWCTELRGMEERRDAFVRMGWSTLALSGAFGIVTLASFLDAGDGDEPVKGKGVHVVPMTTGQAAAVVVKGSF